MSVCMSVCLDGWMVVWLYGCMVVWLFGCLVVWLFGCLVVWLFVCFVCLFCLFGFVWVCFGLFCFFVFLCLCVCVFVCLLACLLVCTYERTYVRVCKYPNQRLLGRLEYYLGLGEGIMFASVCICLYVRLHSIACMCICVIFMHMGCLSVFGTEVCLFRPAVLTKEAWEFHVNCEDRVATGIPGGGCQKVIEPYNGTDWYRLFIHVYSTLIFDIFDIIWSQSQDLLHITLEEQCSRCSPRHSTKMLVV